VKIAVVGGGPAGLCFAALVKGARPSIDVRVLERDPEGATYGWGVVLSNVALSFVKDAIVRNRRWHHGNVVLLGDALRTGHPSIGSGTRLAMQDSIALFRAFQSSGDDVPRALAEFEQARRPGSDELQAAAVKSALWYETVRSRLHLDPVAFAYDYMRRTGRVTHEDLRRRDPALVAAYEALPRER